MINARSETVGTLPAFRDALKSRRCLIPADGFYEWQKKGKTKEPYCFEVNDGSLFAFAGIWDRWKDPSGQWVKSCSILTTTANALTSSVHDRMPVILDPDSYDLWLDPGMKNVSAVSELLKPYDARLMRCYPVSTRINQVANDDAECSAPCGTRPDSERPFLVDCEVNGQGRRLRSVPQTTRDCDQQAMREVLSQLCRSEPVQQPVDSVTLRKSSCTTLQTRAWIAFLHFRDRSRVLVANSLLQQLGGKRLPLLWVVPTQHKLALHRT
jgi:hypothetical protein